MTRAVSTRARQPFLPIFSLHGNELLALVLWVAGSHFVGDVLISVGKGVAVAQQVRCVIRVVKVANLVVCASSLGNPHVRRHGYAPFIDILKLIRWVAKHRLVVPILFPWFHSLLLK
jgi:hypothetical protein